MAAAAAGAVTGAHPELEVRLRRLVLRGDVDAVLAACPDLPDRAVRDLFAPGADRGDLLQAARLGLVDAVWSWSPTGGSTFLTFAMLCARRRAITLVKAATRQKARVLSDATRLDAPITAEDRAATLGELVPDHAACPVEQLEVRDRLRALVAAIADGVLSDLERSAIAGQMNGRTHATIAAAAGVSPKSVDNALQRARAKLQAVDERGRGYAVDETIDEQPPRRRQRPGARPTG